MQEEFRMLERRLAKRNLSITPPASMAMAQRARDLRRSGVDIVDFSLGEPDFDTPQHIKEAAWESLRVGETHYTPSRGYPELLDAIAGRIRRTHGLSLDAHRQIIVTPGGKQAILMGLLALIDPGDEVLAPSPCWLSYADMVSIAGGRLVYVPGVEDKGFIPSEGMLEKCITSRTKAIILNTPCNPTGCVWTREEVERLAAVARRHNLIVISDETYDQIIFDGRPFTSPAVLEGMAERTLVINSFSKSYAMTGWRIGYLVGPSELIAAAAALHQHSATCVAAFTQKAAIAALNGPQQCIREMVKEYQARRDLIVEGLTQMGLFGSAAVSGTFYAMANIKRLKMTSTQAVACFLKEARVVTTPGSAYGAGGEGYVRISFATSRQLLREGLKRLHVVVRKLSGGEPWQGSLMRTSGALQET